MRPRKLAGSAALSPMNRTRTPLPGGARGQHVSNSEKINLRSASPRFQLSTEKAYTVTLDSVRDGHSTSRRRAPMPAVALLTLCPLRGPPVVPVRDHRQVQGPSSAAPSATSPPSRPGCRSRSSASRRDTDVDVLALGSPGAFREGSRLASRRGWPRRPGLHPARRAVLRAALRVLESPDAPGAKAHRDARPLTRLWADYPRRSGWDRVDIRILPSLKIKRS